MVEVSEILYICSDISQLPEVAEKLITDSGSHKIFLFYGDMGAGKTTLIKEVCNRLGVKDIVTSPTFTIVNEYLNSEGESIYHFDFYRIKSETEAYDLGYENYFYSGSYCFIEWPEKIASLLPEKSAKVMITTNGENRIIKLFI